MCSLFRRCGTTLVASIQGPMQASAAELQAREQQRFVPSISVPHGSRLPHLPQPTFSGVAVSTTPQNSVGVGHARTQSQSTSADVGRRAASVENLPAPLVVAINEAPRFVAQAIADDNEEEDSFDDSNLIVPEDLHFETIRKQVWKIERVWERRVQRHAF